MFFFTQNLDNFLETRLHHGTLYFYSIHKLILFAFKIILLVYLLRIVKCAWIQGFKQIVFKLRMLFLNRELQYFFMFAFEPLNKRLNFVFKLK
jgi:hypothetical protein